MTEDHGRTPHPEEPAEGGREEGEQAERQVAEQQARDEDEDESDEPGGADVVDVLTEQHRVIGALFDEVERGEGAARHEAFDRLVRLLAVHETAEEQLIHPLARVTLRSGRTLVDERLAEEHTAKRTLTALEKLGPAAPEFSAVLVRLREEVLEHAHKEEAHEFARLREQLPAVELRALVPLVRAAEAVAPTHPHPGVESATGSVLAGPLLSLFDRTKDLASKAIGKESRT